MFNRLLIAAAATAASAVTMHGQGCAVPPAGLSAWFTSDEPMFNTQVRPPGIGRSALRFDGVSRFFEFPKDTPGFLVGSGDFSVEFWVRTTEKKRTRNLIDFRSFTPKGYLMFMRAGEVGMQVVDEADLSQSVATGFSVADGRWHHVVGVAKRLPPQPAAIYVDGVKRGQNGRSVPITNIDHDTPMWLARHHKNGYINRDNIFFAGDLDEVSVYRRALAPAEVAALHRAGGKGKCRK